MSSTMPQIAEVPVEVESEQWSPEQPTPPVSSPSSCSVSPCPTMVDLASLPKRIQAAEKEQASESDLKLTVASTYDTPRSVSLEEAAPSPNETPAPSSAQKALLLAIFCLAEFLDIFNNSALFPAVPVIGKALDMSPSDLQWIFSAYQLSFASFLLLSGRISDVYSPKWTFISGALILSVMSLAAGFVPSKIGLIVLRALQGIGAALTIPSALSLIVWLYPADPMQSRAIAIYGGTGAIGNVTGLIIGALFSEYVSYQWCFWFITCAAIPAAIASAFLIPKASHQASHQAQPTVAASSDSSTASSPETKVAKASLDYAGVAFLTSAMILFVFGITSGSTVGWAVPQVWVPVVGSGLLLAAFLYWETRLPEADAALPPSMWFYPNFAVLFGLSLLPYAWWTAQFLMFSQLWQDAYGITTLETAVRFLPLGISAGLIIITLAFLPPFPRPKVVLMIGFVGMIVSSIMLPFGRGLERYWSILFPAMIVGSSGASLVFVYTNIAIFQTTPPARSGLTGAAFNSGLQLGSIIVVSAITSITASVNARQPGDPFNGVSASFWFVFACTAVEAIAVALLYKERRREKVEVVDAQVVGEQKA